MVRPNGSVIALVSGEWALNAGPFIQAKPCHAPLVQQGYFKGNLSITHGKDNLALHAL
jgi:hypothetical protein